MLADILYWAPWLDVATFISCLSVIVGVPLWIMGRRRKGDRLSLTRRWFLSILVTWLCVGFHGDFIDAPYFRALDTAYFRIHGPSVDPHTYSPSGLIEVGILVIRLVATIISSVVIAVVFATKDSGTRKTDCQGNLVA